MIVIILIIHAPRIIRLIAAVLIPHRHTAPSTAGIDRYIASGLVCLNFVLSVDCISDGFNLFYIRFTSSLTYGTTEAGTGRGPKSKLPYRYPTPAGKPAGSENVYSPGLSIGPCRTPRITFPSALLLSSLLLDLHFLQRS